MIKAALISSLMLGVASVTGVSLNGGSLEAATAAVKKQQEENSQAKRKTRKVESMTLAVNKKVVEAQEHIELKEYAQALEILNDIQGSKRTNNYEMSIAWQLKAQIFYDQEDVPATIRAYEEVLKLRESIPEAQEVGIIFNLSQLKYSVEDYNAAIAYYKEWEGKSTVIGVKQRVYGAQLYYTIEDFNEAIRYIDLAITEAEAVDTIDVEENWYGLKLSAYWEMNQFENVRDVLEILIINWPSPQYWTQLAGTYQELGQEEISYSVVEAAYKQGFLDEKPAQLENMAQILIARQAPIKAAWVLEDSYGKGLVDKTAKNQRTLGSAYMQASEYAKAVGPLSVAAKGDDTLDADGMLWLQIGNVYSQMDRPNDAVDALDRALVLLKEEDDEGSNESKMRSAQMSRASALIELKQYAEARSALDAARRLGEKRSTVRQWRDYLAGEEAREKILASAGR